MKKIVISTNGVVLSNNHEDSPNFIDTYIDHPYAYGGYIIKEVGKTEEIYPIASGFEGKFFVRDQDEFDRQRKLQWDVVRVQRNQLLTESDWVDLPNTTLSEEKAAAWLEYRQALRDMINEDTNPFAVTWPEKP